MLACVGTVPTRIGFAFDSTFCLILRSAFQFGLRERLCHELARTAPAISARPLFFVECVGVPPWGCMVALRPVVPNFAARFPIRFGAHKGFSHESAHAALSFS